MQRWWVDRSYKLFLLWWVVHVTEKNILEHIGTVSITMVAICAPLLPDTYLYSHEADFIQLLIKDQEK